MAEYSGDTELTVVIKAPAWRIERLKDQLGDATRVVTVDTVRGTNPWLRMRVKEDDE